MTLFNPTNPFALALKPLVTTGINALVPDTVEQRPPTPAVSPQQETPAAPQWDLPHYRQVVGHMESSNRYDIKVPTGKGSTALGKYGILDTNLPQWSREALGFTLTPEQFLKSPAAQDAIFDHKFGSYLRQTGDPMQAASMWYTGRPISPETLKAADKSGFTNAAYLNRFNQLASNGVPVGTATAPQQADPNAPDPELLDPETMAKADALVAKIQGIYGTGTQLPDRTQTASDYQPPDTPQVELPPSEPAVDLADFSAPQERLAASRQGIAQRRANIKTARVSVPDFSKPT